MESQTRNKTIIGSILSSMQNGALNFSRKFAFEITNAIKQTPIGRSVGPREIGQSENYTRDSDLLILDFLAIAWNSSESQVFNVRTIS